MLNQNWDQEWINSQNTFLHKIRNSVLSLSPVNRLKRREQIKKTRLRIGHCRLTHQYLIEKLEPPTCTACMSPKNIQHILLECKLYENTTVKYKIPNNIKECLGNLDLIKATILYLKDIDPLVFI